MTRIAILMACFNRREKTISCLTSLFQCRLPSDVGIEVILVDDASDDGTSDAVRTSFPAVRVITGYSGLYWCRGMHLAWSRALNDDYDYFLWLNDDTRLDASAIETLLATENNMGTEQLPVIVVGSTRDPVNGKVTYGGLVRPSRWRPTRVRLVTPGQEALRCATMNGNCVLISREAYKRVGILDPIFEHAMGDLDYGYRANNAGVHVWLAPGYVGVCARNQLTGTFVDTSLSLSKRWHMIISPKGLPPRSWLSLTKRHAGPLWPLVFVWPYARTVISAFLHNRWL